MDTLSLSNYQGEKREANRFLEKAIQTLKGDESEDAEELQEDRGELVYINNATYQFLSARKYSNQHCS